MFSLPSTVRILVHSQPTDMRMSFDDLAAIFSKELTKNLFAGDDFISFNRFLGSLQNSAMGSRSIQNLGSTFGARAFSASTSSDRWSLHRVKKVSGTFSGS